MSSCARVEKPEQMFTACACAMLPCRSNCVFDPSGVDLRPVRELGSAPVTPTVALPPLLTSRPRSGAGKGQALPEKSLHPASLTQATEAEKPKAGASSDETSRREAGPPVARPEHLRSHPVPPPSADRPAFLCTDFRNDTLICASIYFCHIEMQRTIQDRETNRLFLRSGVLRLPGMTVS